MPTPTHARIARNHPSIHPPTHSPTTDISKRLRANTFTTQAPPIEFLAATLPLSMFPRWDTGSSTWLRSDSAGYKTWTGRFANDDSSQGVGLSRYRGGQEGGPLVLFDSVGSATAVRTTIVLSPASDFNDAVLGLSPDAPPAPPQCTSHAPPPGQCTIYPCTRAHTIIHIIHGHTNSLVLFTVN
jgi:hypothetical protein